MSAGSGVLHSEVNPSPDTPVKLLQIWITPSQPGGEPRYRDFEVAAVPRHDGLALLASPDGRDGSVAIRQNAEVLHGMLEAGWSTQALSATERPYSWLQLVRGEITLGGQSLTAGDAAAFDHADFDLASPGGAEFLFFRLS
jgi:hypothetical protein